MGEDITSFLHFTIHLTQFVHSINVLEGKKSFSIDHCTHAAFQISSPSTGAMVLLQHVSSTNPIDMYLALI